MRKFILLLIPLFLKCAPDAPLKPTPCTIKGEVITLFGSNPLQGAIVQIFPSQKVDTTNAAGEFEFTELVSGVYILTVKKEMYVEKAETISIEKGEEKNIHFQLNGMPTITFYSISSEHSNRHYPYPDERYNAIFILNFFDPDAFIADSVIAESENEKILLNPESGDTIGFYKRILTYFDVVDIDTLIGLQFHFWVKDLGGSYSDTVTTTMVRVIDELPNITFPCSGDTLSLGDTLKWTPPTFDFSGFIILKIWEYGQSVENPIWISDTLLKTDSIYIFTTSIKSGVYDWAVELHDKLGDVSRNIEWFYF